MTSNPQFAPQNPAQNQNTFAPNGGYPTLNPLPNQNQNNYSPPRPNPGMQVNYANPFGAPHQQPHYQIQPQQLNNNAGKNQLQNTVRRNMMLQQMSKNVSASGRGTVICLAIIAVIFGCALANYLRSGENNDKYSRTVDVFVGNTLYEIKFEDFFFTLLIKSRNDKCLYYLAGILSLPVLAMVVFAGFNFFAIIFACCDMTCMAYIQAIWTCIWGILALTEMNSGCGAVNSFLLKFQNNNGPISSAPFFGIMAVLSLAATIANCNWSSSIAKAEEEKKRLSLMATMA